MAKLLDLGFAREVDLQLLTNRYFPSKIGGKPAWLEIFKLPLVEDLKCSKCEQQKSFMCQLYAPIEEKDECFHRTIYLFVCRTKSCWLLNTSDNVTVFRSQLGRANLYYSFQAPDENEKELGGIFSKIKMCSVCGCRGPLMCSRCKKTTYCSAGHQKLDWKNHKVLCKLDSNVNNQPWVPIREITFPEFEIDYEEEEENNVADVSDNQENDDKSATSESDSEAKQIAEYEKLVSEGKDGVLKDISEAELTQYSNSSSSTNNLDKEFKHFKKVITKYPEQIIRYQRNGTPLWICSMDPDILSKIPDCENCGSPRIFEFQVMPQILNYLKDDELDWGVLAIYTCSNSCHPNGYVREIVIQQDIVKN